MFVGVRIDIGKDEFCMHRVKPESVAWYVARLKKPKKLRGEKKINSEHPPAGVI